ncbi:MAG: hypothetical protein AB7Y46_16515 [Armatimonadota bacterium]
MTLLLALAAAAPACAQPLLTAYRARTAPQIDGDLNDACWQSACVTSPFILATDAALPQEQTIARVCFDDARLYLAVEAMERALDPALNMLEMVRAQQTGRDANVFSDDCVEIFLQPPGEAYYHLAVTSIGTLYDARDVDSTWDGDCVVAARRGRKSWTLELAVSFASLGASPTGQWHANFCRERTALVELSTWSGLQGAFHQPAAFGELRFAQSGPAITHAQITIEPDSLLLHAVVGGAADDATQLRGTLASGDQTTTAWAQGPGAHALELGLPAAVRESGRADASLEVAQGDAIMQRWAAIPLTVAAGVASLSLDTADAQVEVFVGGSPVALPDGAADLALQPGLNVIAIRATADGDAPALRAAISSGGRDLPVAWLRRTDEPAEGWLNVIAPEGWETVAGEALAWPVGARQQFLACGIYVGQRGPQLFPKLTTFYLPRGSSQLMRCYVHMPPEVPAEGYRMVVEAPAGLRYVAVEPISGMPPEVVEAARFELRGTAMARHHLTWPTPPGQGMELSMRWGDAHNTTIGYQTALSTGGTHGWRRLSATVTAPEGAVSAHPLIIKWQDRGITGTFWVDNLVLRAADSDENLLEMGTFDEPGWGNDARLVPEGPDGSMCCKIVSTAATANNQQAMWVDKEGVVPVEAGAHYVVEMDVRCEGLGSPTSRPLCGLLFEAPADTTEGDWPLLTWFQSLDGAITELPQPSTVTVLPPLKNVRPARARIAPCYYSSQFTNPDVARAYAENCWASGITWTYGRWDNNVVEHLAPRGHQVILSIGWNGWNPVGEQMNAFIQAHPDTRAVNFEGEPEDRFFCPTWFLSAEAEPVRATLERWLLDSVNSAPYAGADWDLEQPVVDPPTFCTCERCLSAFREFAGLAADTPLTPEMLLGEYRDRWVDFRCTQNATMAGLLKAMLLKADRPVEFSVYSGFQSVRTREHYGVDWAKLAPHIDMAIAGYGGSAETVAATIGALGDTPLMGGEMWYLSHRDDAQAAPRMETWRNRLLRKFVESGCVGVLIWWLPAMDGGAFYATSEAAALIAQYEDWLVHERRCDERVTVEGLPARDWAAFERDGRVLVLLLSFADEATQVTVTVGGTARRLVLEGHAAEVLVVDR